MPLDEAIGMPCHALGVEEFKSGETGAVVEPTDDERMTRRTPQVGEPIVEIHPATAEAAGVRAGDHVMLTTRRGSARFVAATTATIRQDTVFVPTDGTRDHVADQLTRLVADPAARSGGLRVGAARIDRVD